jgi:CHAT domain-containing protein
MAAWLAPSCAALQSGRVPDLGPSTATYVEAWKAYARGDYDRALSLAKNGLEADRKTGAGKGIAEALNLIGTVHYKHGEYAAALEIYQEAEQAAEQSGYDFGLARDWSSLGSTYYRTGRYTLALQFYEKSLVLRKKLGAGDDEIARALDDLANVYQQLSDLQRSLSLRNQSLALFQEAGDQVGVSDVLNDIGWTYDQMGNSSEALENYRRSLVVAEHLELRTGILDNLDGIGIIEGELRHYAQALDALSKSLAGYQSLGQEDEISQLLNDIGQVYLEKGEPDQAVHRLQEALSTESELGNTPVEAVTFALMMDCLHAQNELSLAVFYGKQSVNLLQQVRNDIESLDRKLQTGFLHSKEDVYRDLAAILIEQGRLAEAQQVLDLLKQQEYTDYVRGDPGKMLGSLSLTPAEQQAEADYQKSTAQLVSIGEQWAELKKISERTPEQEQRFEQLNSQISKANQELNEYYIRLYKLLGGSHAANHQEADVKSNVASLRGQVAHMPNTVALYTMLTKDHYRVIVVTGSATVAREYAITEKEITQKVAAFQQVLRDPSQNPQPLASDLYKILIGPIKADLDQAQAKTLIWSLDDVLRYIPMAALYDGSHYLVENYNLVSITPASISHLGDRPQMGNISAVAMGISRKYEDDLNPLPTVVAELDDIVKDPQVQGANGVLPGSILLNSQFTERAMEQQLDGQHPIVHIASHFVFKPGDDNASYLLLAGKDTDSAGYHLTVADFRDNQNFSLDETDLLTLSACETGVGSNAGNGREVDGLAMTAELKGAKAVISSLWEVSDASTGELMADFYKRWADGNGKVMKVEALRKAQLDLLQGRIEPAPNYSDPNAPTSFAHPYYWAPFVLTGNWR